MIKVLLNTKTDFGNGKFCVHVNIKSNVDGYKVSELDFRFTIHH